MMRMLERFDLKSLGPGVDSAHLVASAQALAEADRGRWLADPSFAQVPQDGLLDPGYLKQRGDALSVERAPSPVSPGQPPGALASARFGESLELASTSHFVIVDREGSIATMTTSIEFGFGSHVMVGGFLLNNQLTDFAFTPESDGRPVFNSVQPGKRPRSAMSPTIVFDSETGRPLFALGSPGGPRIIAFVGQTLVGLLDHGLSPNQAIAAPRVAYAKGELEVEDVGWAGDEKKRFVDSLTQRGHRVSVVSLNSGLHAVALTPEGVIPGIDPRREGEAEGN
jgi:gamma-glutamyltranspeptidase/glutathione hydrolase